MLWQEHGLDAVLHILATYVLAYLCFESIWPLAFPQARSGAATRRNKITDDTSVINTNSVKGAMTRAGSSSKPNTQLWTRPNE